MTSRSKVVKPLFISGSTGWVYFMCLKGVRWHLADLVSTGLLCYVMLMGNKQADICTSLCHMVAVTLIKATYWHWSLSFGIAAAACLKIICVVSDYPTPSSVDQKPSDLSWHRVFHTPLNRTSPLLNLWVQSYLNKAGIQTESGHKFCALYCLRDADIFKEILKKSCF